MPSLPLCVLPNYTAASPPTPLTLQLFSSNLVQYKTTASHCRFVKTTITTKCNFIGSNQCKDVVNNDMLVSFSQCQAMLASKNSPYGTLQQNGEIFQTRNKVEFKYRAGFYCCKPYQFSAVNAYLVPTFVLKRYGDTNPMESMVGNVAHCHYERGTCSLADGSFLLWTPNTTETCEFLPNKQYVGKVQGNTWLADDGELALTFTKAETVSMSSGCGGDVELSDQHIAIQRLPDRSRRAVSSHYNRSLVDIVLNSGLNARLQALELRMKNNLVTMFKSTLKSTCHYMQTATKLLAATLASDPSTAARILLNNSYVYARMTGDLITVYPCQSVLDYHVVPSETCSSRIPMAVIIKEQNYSMYLDTVTNILYHNPLQEDCMLDYELPVVLGEHAYFYHHKTGDLRKCLSHQRDNYPFFDLALLDGPGFKALLE
jgi:hypothetical protein